MLSKHSAKMRKCLAEGDVAGMRALWPSTPKDDAEALVVLHHARTCTATLPLTLRQYSDAWLTERGLRSGLPSKHKPVVADSVGIAVGSRWPEVKLAIRGAMEGAVNDCYADNQRDPKIVKPRMMEMREYMRRKLFGPISEIAKRELSKLRR